MTIMLRKEQRAASGEGKTARKFQSNYHMITVGGKWAVTAGPDKSGRPLQQDNRSFSFRLSHFPNDRAKRKRKKQPYRISLCCFILSLSASSFSACFFSSYAFSSAASFRFQLLI